MFRTVAATALITLLAGCGPSPMGASEGGAPPPADAPASSPPGPDFSGDFDLAGTEPFWGGRIQSDGLTLTRSGQPDVAVANPGVKIEGETGVWSAGRLVIKLTAEPCSDGMSPRHYDYRAEATLDGKALKGCAGAPVDLDAPKP